MMKKLLVTAFSMAIASSTLAAAAPNAEASQAQAGTILSESSAERLALARRFIEATAPADAWIQLMRAGIWQTASADIEEEGDRAIAEEGLDRLFDRIAPLVRQKMPTVIEKYAQVYAREFSADDLRQMVAFAESPAGKRYLLRYAALESDPVLLQAQSDLWESITPAMEDFQKEECGKRTAEHIAAGDSKAKCRLTGEPETRPS